MKAIHRLASNLLILKYKCCVYLHRFYSASARAKNPIPCALNFLSNCSSHLFKRGTVCGALSGAKEER